MDSDKKKTTAEQEDNIEPASNSLSSPSTEEGGRDFFSSYTQISQSQDAFGATDDQTDIESDGGEDELSLDEPKPKATTTSTSKLPEDGAAAASLPQLSSQIVEWSRSRFHEYDQGEEDEEAMAEKGDGNTEFKDQPKTTLREQIEQDFDQLTMQDKEHFRFVQTKLLDKIEVYAQVLANDLQNIFANVGDATSKSTKTSIEAMKVFDSSVDDICVNVDVNIKLMYKIIAKCGELNRSLESIEILSSKIREVKHTLDVFERLLDKAQL